MTVDSPPRSQQTAPSQLSASTTSSPPALPSFPRTPSTRSFATFTRQISASSIPVARGEIPQSGSANRRDAIFYEQQEERPLVHMEDLGMRNAPITHITASPMPRRSRLSRLGSIITSRNADIEQSRGHHHEQIHWPRSLHRDPLETAREDRRHHSRRLSLYGADSRETLTEARRSGRREFAPISQPMPLHGEPTTPSSFLAVSSQDDPSRRHVVMEPTRTHQSSGFLAPPISRLARFRRSVSLPFDVSSSFRRSPPRDRNAQPPPQRPTRDSLLTGGLTPRSSLRAATPNDFSSTMSNGDHNGIRESRRVGLQNRSDSPGADGSPARGTGLTDRWADRSSMGWRESRRVSSMLGGRSTRLLRRDQDEPLPHILNLAAFAMAAGLARSNAQTAGNVQEIGPDDLDGNLHNIFWALQNTMHQAAGESSVTENGQGSARPQGPANPLSYLRVFRFVRYPSGPANQAEPSISDRPNATGRANDQHATAQEDSEEPEGRTVMLVMIGIRSVPSEAVVHEASATSESGLDSLLEVPRLASATDFSSGGASDLSRPTNGRSRFPHRRRASSGGIIPFPADYDRQRHQRTFSTRSTSGLTSADGTPVLGSATPDGVASLPVSISPPGPRPPPSTPAEPGLSAYSSRVPTPSRRPSSASIAQQPQTSTRDAAMSHLSEAAHPITGDQDQPTVRVQQRRRSDSEFARHRDLGAGAARRNGVIAPDDVDPPASTASGSRSWLVYIVGTNLNEDHPALTAPSLFTDVSSSKVLSKDYQRMNIPEANIYLCRALHMKICCSCHHFLDQSDHLLRAQKMLRLLEAFSVSAAKLATLLRKARKAMAPSNSALVSAAWSASKSIRRRKSCDN